MHSLYSGIILRYAQKPMTIPGDDACPPLLIPEHSTVAISPFLLHHDPRFFSAPNTYLPSRHLSSRSFGANAKKETAPSSNAENRQSCPVAGLTGSGHHGCHSSSLADSGDHRACMRTREASRGRVACMSMTEGICHSDRPREGCVGTREGGEAKIAIGPGDKVHEPHLQSVSRDAQISTSCVGAAGVQLGCMHACSSDAATQGARVDPAPIQVAFGAGAFRCPGRAFARCLLRLSVAAFFLPGNTWQLCDPPDALCDGCSHEGGGKEEVPRWLAENIVPGGHVFARGLCSGDKGRRLPQARSQLLVGIKRPLGPLWARAE
jgi:hypothetical protein